MAGAGAGGHIMTLGCYDLEVPNNKLSSCLGNGGYTEYPRDPAGTTKGTNSDLLKLTDCLRDLNGPIELSTISGPNPLCRHVFPDRTDHPSGGTCFMPDSEHAVRWLLGQPGHSDKDMDHVLHLPASKLGEGAGSLNLHGERRRRPVALVELVDHLTIYSSQIKTIGDVMQALVRCLDDVCDVLGPVTDLYKDGLRSAESCQEPYYIAKTNMEARCLIRNGVRQRTKTYLPNRTLKEYTRIEVLKNIVTRLPAAKPEKRAEASRNVATSNLAYMVPQFYVENCTNMVDSTEPCTNRKTNEQVLCELEAFAELGKAQPDLTVGDKHYVSNVLTISEDDTSYNVSINHREFKTIWLIITALQDRHIFKIGCLHFWLMTCASMKETYKVHRGGWIFEVLPMEMAYGLLRLIKTYQKHGAEYTAAVIRNQHDKEINGDSVHNRHFTIRRPDIAEQGLAIFPKNKETTFEMVAQGVYLTFPETYTVGNAMGMGNNNKLANESQSYSLMLGYGIMKKAVPTIHAICEALGLTQVSLQDIVDYVRDDVARPNPAEHLILLSHEEYLRLLQAKDPQLGVSLSTLETLPVSKKMFHVSVGVRLRQVLEEAKPVVTLDIKEGQRSDDSMVLVITYQVVNGYVLTLIVGTHQGRCRKLSDKKTVINNYLLGTLFSRPFVDGRFIWIFTSVKRGLYMAGISPQNDLASAWQMCVELMGTHPSAAIFCIMRAMYNYRRRYRKWGTNEIVYAVTARAPSLLAKNKAVDFERDMQLAEHGGNTIFHTALVGMNLPALEAQKALGYLGFKDKLPTKSHITFADTREGTVQTLQDSRQTSADTNVSGTQVLTSKSTGSSHTLGVGAELTQVLCAMFRSESINATTMYGGLTTLAVLYPDAKGWVEIVRANSDLTVPSPQ